LGIAASVNINSIKTPSRHADDRAVTLQQAATKRKMTCRSGRSWKLQRAVYYLPSSIFAAPTFYLSRHSFCRCRLWLATWKYDQWRWLHQQRLYLQLRRLLGRCIT